MDTTKNNVTLNRSIKLASTYRAQKREIPRDGVDGAASKATATVPPPSFPTVSPEDAANFFSTATWHWLTPMLFLGYKRPLQNGDIYPLPKTFRAEYLAERFEESWKIELDRWIKEETVDPISGKLRVSWRPKDPRRPPAWFFGLVKHKEPSVLSACARIYGRFFAGAGVLRLISDGTQVTSPILLNFLINYIMSSGSGEHSVGYGLGFVFAMFALAIINAFALHHFWWTANRSGFLASRSLITAVYAKSLRLSQAARAKYFSGKMVTMMSTDSARIEMTAPQFHVLWASPLLIFTAFIVLVINLGVSGLVGFLVLITVVPVSAKLMRISMRLRKKTSLLTDERVKLTQECIAGIRVVKLQGWEEAILERINAIRAIEMTNTRRLLVMRASVSAMVTAQPVFASLCMFAVYTALGNTMTVAKTFSSIALMQLIRYPCMFLPIALSQTADCLVSVHRIQGLLLADELGTRTIKDSHADLEQLETAPNTSDQSVSVGAHAEFVWDEAPDDAADGPGAKKTKRRKDERRKSVATSGSEATAKEKEEVNAGNELERMFEGPVGDSKLSVPLGTTMLNAQVEAPELVAAAARAVAKVDARAEVDANSHNFKLHDMDLQIPRGNLIAIVGAVGSGKSSLIQAIIGEMRCSSTVGAEVRGKVQYAPQTAWIVNDTLRGNILFGEPHDEERYERTIKVCALERDLAMLPAGDMTEVGERGINLSGGQKARLSLARATYAALSQKRPGECVVVLDDPLSAVDAHVGKHLFDECIKGALAGSTRILATHQVHVVDRADWVVVMDHGKIREQGRYHDLMQKDGGYLEYLMNEFLGGKKRKAQHSRQVSETFGGETKGASSPTMVDAKTSTPVASPLSEKGDLDSEDETDADDSSADGSEEEDEEVAKTAAKKGALVVAEERDTGSVSFAIYKNYIYASGGPLVWLCLALMLAGIQCARIGADVWLSYWSIYRFPISESTYILVYFAIGVAQAIFIFGAFTFCAFVGYLASIKIHQQAITSVTRSPVSFFDTTPAGRIVNRFSRDTDAMDNLVPEFSRVFLAYASLSAGILIYIAVVAPWFLAPAVPLLILYFFVTRYYRHTARELRRLEAISRSPLFDHLGETLNGLATIRAFGAQDRFLAENRKRVDANGRNQYHMSAASRWLTFRLESISALLVLATMLFAVLGSGSGLSATLLSLAVTYSLQVTTTMQWSAEDGSILEREFNSIERLTYYGQELPQEAEAIVENNRPPKDWPSKGEIKFEHVELRYRPDLPPVLRDVTVKIEPGQLVGIVGRTGAGKSSIIMSLFRMVELSAGKILIDGVDISTIGLHDLRSNVAIIPQDSVLFSGTVRYNLDPFNEYPDEEIWEVLARAGDLKSVVSASPMKLEMPVADNGENFSAGQRSMMCLARAMLRKSQIVVLDEATANVDVQTDALIQKTIREDDRFRGKTIMTIAHRLNTIADYDVIIFMEAGQIKEVGAPQDLMVKPDSLFRGLVEETGEQNAAAIMQIINRKVNGSNASLPPLSPAISVLAG